MHLAPWNFSSPLLVESHGERGKEQRSRFCFRICSVELLKPITCGKPWRATKGAAAARFFDDDARNLYGAYLRKVKRKYAPHVPEAYLMVAREISRVRAKKIPQMREWRCAAGQIKTRAFLFDLAA